MSVVVSSKDTIEWHRDKAAEIYNILNDALEEYGETIPDELWDMLDQAKHEAYRIRKELSTTLNIWHS